MEQNNRVVYRQWEDGFRIRSMARRDAKIVQQWYNDICPTSTDLDIVLDICDPQGKFFFIGELNGDVIASIANVPVCDGGLFYLSYLYVAEEYRKYGYGRRMLDEAYGSVGEADVVSLDSHEELEEVQKRRGCVSSFNVTLYEGEVDTIGPGKMSEAVTEELKVEASSMESLFAYDDFCFIRPGSDFRRKLLARWTAIPGGKTVVASTGAGAERGIVGFGCRRPSFQEGNHLIGPLYADNPGVARDLVVALTKDIPGQKIWINICKLNAEAVQLTNDLHLRENLHMIRMNKNGDPGPLSPRVFAITSIDVCGF